MRVTPKAVPLLAFVCVGAALLTSAAGCGKKSPRGELLGQKSGLALPELPEPVGVLAEVRVSHPDATYRSTRQLGRLGALLPAGFPMLSASLLGLPPLSADSFDAELPVVGLLLQGPNSEPGWVLALHVVSGPELVAKLCAGDRAPFQAASAGVTGLQTIEPNPKPRAAAFSLGVFDEYLLVASSPEVLVQAGPYAARTLPRRPALPSPVTVRFSQSALEGKIVPALRGLWAGYRTRLARLDQSERSAHGGRAPDFADPAQVILGADAAVEAALALIDSSAMLELDVEPSPERLDVTVQLEPEAGSEVQAKVSSLVAGNARGLLSLPGETSFALGLSRSSEEREAAGKAAGDDWVRLLGTRLTPHEADQLRSVLSDWELGRGAQTRYGFWGGSEPSAFLVTDVADAVRLKRASTGLFGLLSVPGLRAPLSEFLGSPRLESVATPAPSALPGASHRRIGFSPVGGRPARVPPLEFAWRVDESLAFAAAGRDADAGLLAVVDSAAGHHPTLSATAGISDAVQRIGEQAALYAYLDARVLSGATGPALPTPAPVLLALGKRGTSAWVRLEIAKPAVDLLSTSLLGR